MIDALVYCANDSTKPAHVYRYETNMGTMARPTCHQSIFLLMDSSIRTTSNGRTSVER